MTTNEIIKNLRIQKKISQKSIAEKVGISQQAFALIEQGKRKLDFNFFIAILEGLECTTQEKIICLNELLDLDNINSIESLESMDSLRDVQDITFKNIFALCSWNVDDTLKTGDIVIFTNTANPNEKFTISLDRYYEFQMEITRYIIFSTRKLQESNNETKET